MELLERRLVVLVAATRVGASVDCWRLRLELVLPLLRLLQLLEDVAVREVALLCSDELQLAESSGQKSGHSSSEASSARFKSFSSSLLGFLVCRYLNAWALVARRLGLEQADESIVG